MIGALKTSAISPTVSRSGHDALRTNLPGRPHPAEPLRSSPVRLVAAKATAVDHLQCLPEPARQIIEVDLGR